MSQELAIIRQILTPLKKDWFRGMDFKDSQDEKRNAKTQSSWEMVWFNPKFYRVVMILVPSINIGISLFLIVLTLVEEWSYFWLIPFVLVVVSSVINLHNYLKTHQMSKILRVNFYDILLREDEE